MLEINKIKQKKNKKNNFVIVFINTFQHKMADLQISPILPCLAPFPTVAEVGADWYSFPSQEVVEITHDRPRTGCGVREAKLCLLFFPCSSWLQFSYASSHPPSPVPATTTDDGGGSGPCWVKLVLGNGLINKWWQMDQALPVLVGDKGYRSSSNTVLC